MIDAFTFDYIRIQTSFQSYHSVINPVLRNFTLRESCLSQTRFFDQLSLSPPRGEFRLVTNFEWLECFRLQVVWFLLLLLPNRKNRFRLEMRSTTIVFSSMFPCFPLQWDRTNHNEGYFVEFWSNNHVILITIVIVEKLMEFLYIRV